MINSFLWSVSHWAHFKDPCKQRSNVQETFFWHFLYLYFSWIFSDHSLLIFIQILFSLTGQSCKFRQSFNKTSWGAVWQQEVRPTKSKLDYIDKMPCSSSRLLLPVVCITSWRNRNVWVVYLLFHEPIYNRPCLDSYMLVLNWSVN